MNRSARFVVLLVAALMAFTMLNDVEAACKVKQDEGIANDAEVNVTASNDNRIQDSPSKKRLVNKIAFDVVDEAALKRKRMANKIAFDVTAKSDEDDESNDEGADYVDNGN